MRKYLYSIFLTAILSTLLWGCSNVPDLPPSDGLSTPSLLSSSPSQFDPFSILHLEGKLEVIQLDGNVTVREIDLAVHSVPINPERPNSAKYLQIIPVGGVRVDDLKGGDHLFRLNLFDRSDREGEIQIAKIETTVHLERGKNTPINFSESSWDYNFDEDQDTFSNVAELTNGYFKDGDNGKGDNANWVSTPTKVKDPNDHPKSNFILAKEIIGSTSPDEQGNSMLIGDTRSVQAGTKFTLFHRKKSDGTIEKITFYSRLDGSFEVPIKGSGADDEITVVASSTLQGDEVVPPKDLNPTLGTSITIKYHPIKMTLCGPLPGKDPIAGNGYVILEGEGISSVATQNEVSFPTASGDYVKTTDLKISGQTARTTELTVRIPATAISGFPRVHSKSSQSESVGACPKDQDVVILQNNNPQHPLPDLYLTLVDAPQIALLGQLVTIDIHIVNQGLLPVENNSFPYYTYLSTDTPLVPNYDLFNEMTDLIIYPNAFDFKKSEVGPERISSRLDKGTKITPSRNQFFYTRASLLKPEPGRSEFFGPILFKSTADPISSGFFGGGNSVLEQNENNNSRAATHNTFIHYIDLDFLKASPSINWKQPGLSPVGIELTPGDKYYSPSAKGLTNIQSLLLKRNEIVSVDLTGNMNNHGNFPMVDLKNGKNGYGVKQAGRWDAVDPLNTEGDLYQSALALYSKKDEAEGETDLKKPLAVELIEQADAFNQNEYPVLIHAYYSEDEILSANPALVKNGEKPDWLIQDSQGIRKWEVCLPRIEQYGSDTTPIHLDIPLDSEGFAIDKGYLFIVAEVAQLDSQKVRNWKNREENKGKQFPYCTLSAKEREIYNLKTSLSTETSNPLNSLPDFNSQGNVVMIPISTTAPDIEFVSNGQINAGNNISLGNNFSVNFQLINSGNAPTPDNTDLEVSAAILNSATKQPVDIKSPVAVYKTSLPAGNATPMINNFQIGIETTSIDDLERIPLGAGELILIADPNNKIFEANRSHTGEKNNKISLPVNIVAPDLKIYALGFTSGGGCDNNGSCNFETSTGADFNFDVYILNDGTGEAKAGYPIKIEVNKNNDKGSNCFKATAGTGPLLPAGQVVKVPVKVTVDGSASCYSADPVSISGIVNPSLDDKNTHSLIEKNPVGVLDAFGNNNKIPKRFTSTDLGAAPFDPKTKSADFTDLTSSGGVVDLKAKIKGWNLDVTQVPAGEKPVSIVGKNDGNLIGTNQVYQVRFFVKNIGDGKSPDKVPVAVYFQDKNGNILTDYPFLEEKEGSQALPTIPAIANDGNIHEMVVNMRVPFKAGVKDALSGVDPYKIKLMVNPNSSGLDEKDDVNKGNNLTGSLDGFQVSHFDLIFKENMTMTIDYLSYCDVDKKNLCSFGVIGEPSLRLTATVKAIGSTGYEISKVGAKAKASFGGIDSEIDLFTIGSNGIGEQTVVGIVTPAGSPAPSNNITVKLSITGELYTGNNEKTSPSYVTHVRPEAMFIGFSGGVFSKIEMKGKCVSSEAETLLSGYWTYTAERILGIIPNPYPPEPNCQFGIEGAHPNEVNASSIDVNQKCDPLNYGNYHFTLICKSKMGEAILENSDKWDSILKP